MRFVHEQDGECGEVWTEGVTGNIDKVVMHFEHHCCLDVVLRMA